jgi:UDP-3-O-[3-hydroxymyristoyl] glucosamine N-acyltransferase
MQMGAHVHLPASTWIDRDFCYLISIGDGSVFGEECLILAHDAQMDEFLDAGKIGRVVIGANCHIGPRTTIMPGVEVGAGTVVAPHSVVLRSLPPDSYCGGNPARVLSTLAELVAEHRDAMRNLPRYDCPTFDRLRSNDDTRRELRDSLAKGGYLVAGDAPDA